MTNLEKYDKIFRTEFKKKQEELPSLRYRADPKWDSMGHMNLVSALEEEFEIMMDTPDMLALSTYEKGKEILRKYGVIIEEN